MADLQLNIGLFELSIRLFENLRSLGFQQFHRCDLVPMGLGQGRPGIAIIGLQSWLSQQRVGPKACQESPNVQMAHLRTGIQSLRASSRHVHPNLAITMPPETHVSCASLRSTMRLA